MKVFAYTTKTVAGKVVKRKVKANNLNQAQAFLRRKKIVPLTISEEGNKFLDKLLKEKTVRLDEIVAFSQLFAGCIRSGLTIKESLALISKQIENRLLKETLSDIIINIEGGTTLSEAFKKKNNVFPKFYAMLLKAGEASGNLESVLEYIGNYLDKTNDLKKQIKGVLTYPIIVSVIGMSLLVVILIYVAPTFKDVFSASQKALPVPTVVLFYLSDLVTNNIPLIIISILSIVLMFIFLYRSKNGKRLIHLALLKNPLFGKLTREVMLLRFLGGFDILVNNQVPIIQSLQVLEDSTTNVCLKEIIVEMRKDVTKGLPLSGPLINQKEIISPMVSYTISTGEKSGTLGTSLSRITKFMDKEITFTIKKLSSRIDPLLTFGLGMVVLFIALAIYLPIFEMMSIAN